jgi:hypothetical protein
MIAGFTTNEQPVQSGTITTRDVSESCFWRGVLDTILCDKVCQ